MPLYLNDGLYRAYRGSAVKASNGTPPDEEAIADPIDWLKSFLPKAQSKEGSIYSEGVRNLLEGECLLIPPSGDRFLSCNVCKVENRSISEPTTEASIRGPREGFVEDIARNVALIRKRLKSEQLVFESMVIGSDTKTSVYLAYMEDAASPKVVDEFRRRLLSINTDSILESSYIEEWIQDSTLSPFPQLINTERPDSIAAKLVEGQVAVLTDGTPMVLVGPITFFQLFNSPEDYISGLISPPSPDGFACSLLCCRFSYRRSISPSLAFTRSCCQHRS